LPGSKRSTPSEEEDGLENTGLPNSVRAVDVIACRVERELDLSQTSEIDDAYAAQRQLSRTPQSAYRRIGMTTNFVLLSPGSRIRQLEFESCTPNSTCSARNRSERVEQIVHVEPDLHRIAGVLDLERFYRLLLLGVVRLQYDAVSPELEPTPRYFSFERMAVRCSACLRRLRSAVMTCSAGSV
jgi:hypothetical protein